MVTGYEQGFYRSVDGIERYSRESAGSLDQIAEDLHELVAHQLEQEPDEINEDEDPAYRIASALESLNQTMLRIDQTLRSIDTTLGRMGR